tara:strand:+ start:273 stop:533 length:261 start_codon:yes stop_codon:yes gene_type:complete
MANHKSAKKRSRQNVKRSAINSTAMSKFKTSLNKLEASIKDKDTEKIDESLRSINSALARAAKRGIIKKEFVSRKLSSLSKKIKNI